MRGAAAPPGGWLLARVPACQYVFAVPARVLYGTVSFFALFEDGFNLIIDDVFPHLKHRRSGQVLPIFLDPDRGGWYLVYCLEPAHTATHTPPPAQPPPPDAKRESGEQTGNREGVAAHVTTARVRAAVAPVLSLSALPPPPVIIAGCVCNDYSSCARSCPGLPAVPSALASGLPEAFLESAAAGYYSV
eukprot:COSAG01_NODE_10111_length_2248_cov_43.019079_2_plen_189_part_00